MQTEVLDAGGDPSTEKDPRDYAATNIKRFGNFLVDSAIFYILKLILISLLYALDIKVNANETLSSIFSLSSYLLYYFILEFISGGKTVGKYLTKTRVVYKDGSTPKAASIIQRAFCRFIPFDAFSFLSSNPIGWHDKLSDTIVIDEETFNA